MPNHEPPCGVVLQKACPEKHTYGGGANAFQAFYKHASHFLSYCDWKMEFLDWIVGLLVLLQQRFTTTLSLKGFTFFFSDFSELNYLYNLKISKSKSRGREQTDQRVFLLCRINLKVSVAVVPLSAITPNPMPKTR